MKTVTIEKQKLLKHLKENREKHLKEYVESHDNWEKKVIETLERALFNAKKDAVFKTHFNIPEPQSFIEEYDTVIEQLKWTEDGMIELDLHEFQRFVQDKWDWKNSFDTTKAFYLKN